MKPILDHERRIALVREAVDLVGEAEFRRRQSVLLQTKLFQKAIPMEKRMQIIDEEIAGEIVGADWHRRMAAVGFDDGAL